MNEIRAGQIWREVDPRFDRFVRVLGFAARIGEETRVAIETVTKDTRRGEWYRTPRSRTGEAHVSRFNGKRGGYELMEDVTCPPR